MKDGRGREIDYVRISITDRCNLRCVYCMPEEGVSCLEHEDILSFEEIERLCRIFATLGIHKIKITGGEPLVRKGCTELIEKIHGIPGIDAITLTTNGVLLSQYMEGLVEAGLTGVNISLDTLNSGVNKELTRREYWKETMKGIESALTFPDLNVKINCVPMMGVNDDQLCQMARLAENQKVHVRFIEMMPMGMGKDFDFIGEDQVIGILEKELGKLTPYSKILGNGPAHYYEIDGYKGKIGFISARSHKFCNTCNRIRITSDGNLKTCLQYGASYHLKELLEGSKSDEEIKEVIKEALVKKPESHQFENLDKLQEADNNNMVSIGG